VTWHFGPTAALLGGGGDEGGQMERGLHMS
jgi:hypothetical protein